MVDYVDVIYGLAWGDEGKGNGSCWTFLREIFSYRKGPGGHGCYLCVLCEDQAFSGLGIPGISGLAEMGR